MKVGQNHRPQTSTKTINHKLSATRYHSRIAKNWRRAVEEWRNAQSNLMSVRSALFSRAEEPTIRNGRVFTTTLNFETESVDVSRLLFLRQSKVLNPFFCQGTEDIIQY